jgi:hypothetical protein
MVLPILKGLLHDFHHKIMKDIKILPKLRGYNNYSRQIAFEMEETQVKNFVYKLNPRRVLKHGTEQKRNKKQNE